MTTREGEVSSGRLYCKESAAQLGASIRIHVIGGNEFGFPAGKMKNRNKKREMKKVRVAKGLA